MAFHFFTEPSKIEAQTVGQAYGAIDASQFRLGNMFTATSSQTPKAFAIADGTVLVQEISGGNYSIVLKPLEQSQIGLPKIAYIIYKGIKGEGLVSGAKVANNDTDANQLVKNIHDSAALYYASKGIPIPNTEPAADSSLGLGYKEGAAEPVYDIADEDLLDNVFFAENGIVLPSVKGGDYIGDFSENFGIVIVFEKIGYDAKFNLAREADSILNITGPSITDADIFNHKNQKEASLCFIDSAAFFGAFFLEGLKVFNGTGFSAKKEAELYTDVISKHFNKNKVYVDIKNEFDDSFNYYENYGDVLKWSLDNTATFVDVNYYRNNGWPVLVIDDASSGSEFASSNIDKVIKLSFATNPRTIFYYKKVFKKDLGIILLGERQLYFKPTDIEGRMSPEDLIAPKTGNRAVANYFQLRLIDTLLDGGDAISPTGLSIEKNTYLDNLFPFSSMKIPFDESSGKSGLKIYYDVNYVDKALVNGASYTADLGVAKDSSFLTFISLPNKYNLNIRLNTDDKIPLSGLEGAVNSLFLIDLDNRMSSVELKKGKFVVGGVEKEFLKFVGTTSLLPEEVPEEQSESVMTPMSNRGFDTFTFEDVSIVCLTLAQYNTLEQLKLDEFEDSPRVFLGIENVTVDIDDLGYTYTKFEYCLRGLKIDGGNIITHTASPVPAIEVYTDVKIKGQPYQRNFEEQQGAVTLGDESYEDLFISDIPEIKTIVTDFTTKLNAIDVKNVNFFAKVRLLVKEKSEMLWTQAKTKVHGNPGLTDRPLYWARLKMELLLKQHPYFIGDTNENSTIISDSKLDTLINVFEQKSRNYDGIDFSGAGPGQKKILITGFDPFYIFENHGCFNPSGITALALDKVNLPAGGYIRSMIFPVRYNDFDDGVVEKTIFQYIDDVDIIVTISLGRITQHLHDVERFAAKNRGDNYVDNLSLTGTIAATFYSPNNGTVSEIEADQLLEFYETTLPVAPMVLGTLTNNVVVYNQSFKTNSQEVTIYGPGTGATNSTVVPGPTEISIEGSGDSFLSNEIFFRISAMRENMGLSTLQSGHLHIPLVSEDDTAIENLVNEVKTILNDAI